MLADSARRWRNSLATLLRRRYIRLPEAASRLYQQAGLRPIAQANANLPHQEVTNGCALILLDSNEIAVFGKKSQSSTLEQIPRTELKALVLSEDATTLREASDLGRALFTDLALDAEKFGQFLSKFAPIQETSSSLGQRTPSGR